MNEKENTLLSLRSDKKHLMADARSLREKLSKIREELRQKEKEFIDKCPHFFYVHWADNSLTNKPTKKFHSHCIICDTESNGSLDELTMQKYLYRIIAEGVDSIEIEFEDAGKLFWKIFVSLINDCLYKEEEAFEYAKLIMSYIYSKQNDNCIDELPEKESSTVKTYIYRYNNKE